MKRVFVNLLACIALAGIAGGAAVAQTIVVGGKAFTEQQIMTAMTVAILKAKGFTPDRKAGMGTAAVRSALENGQIDVYWEYTGTGLGVFYKITDKFPSPEAAYQKIKELDAAKGIVWLNMSPVNNTYAFAMNKDDAQKRGIVTMSDFAKAIKGGAKLTFASNAEFYARPDGLPGWQTAYGFEIDRENVKRMDTGLSFSSLPAASSHASSLREQITILDPASARPVAIWKPMPVAPPVTTLTCPSRLSNSLTLDTKYPFKQLLILFE